MSDAWGGAFGASFGDAFGESEAAAEAQAEARSGYRFQPLPRRPRALENDEALLFSLID